MKIDYITPVIKSISKIQWKILMECSTLILMKNEMITVDGYPTWTDAVKVFLILNMGYDNSSVRL